MSVNAINSANRMVATPLCSMIGRLNNESVLIVRFLDYEESVSKSLRKTLCDRFLRLRSYILLLLALYVVALS